MRVLLSLFLSCGRGFHVSVAGTWRLYIYELDKGALLDFSISAYYRCGLPSSPSTSRPSRVCWGAPVIVCRRQLLRVSGWLRPNRGLTVYLWLYKKAFATSCQLEDPQGARCGMICVLTSSSC